MNKEARQLVETVIDVCKMSALMCDDSTCSEILSDSVELLETALKIEDGVER